MISALVISVASTLLLLLTSTQLVAGQNPLISTATPKIPLSVLLKDQANKCSEENSRVEHPFNAHQFIVCIGSLGDYAVMDCPDNLVFNRYLDRCDYNSEPITPCASQPCLYGSTCIELPDFDYRCICLPGFSGAHCEQAPDVCALHPCGSNGHCHVMPAGSPIPYYCSCFGDQGFGMGCEPRQLERNPCLSGVGAWHDVFYLTRLDHALFIQCDEKHMHLKFCARPLVFSVHHRACVNLMDLYTTTTTTTPSTTTTTQAPAYYYPQYPQYQQYYYQNYGYSNSQQYV